MGYVVAVGAQSFRDIAAGKGLVVVELSVDKENLGFSSRLAEANANNLIMEEQMKRMRAEIAAEMAQMMGEFASGMGENEAEVTALMDTLKDEVCEREAEISALRSELREKGESKDNRIHSLEVQLRDLIVLSDRVKIRVALIVVRKAVAEAIGRAKSDTETWATFITGIFDHRNLRERVESGGSLEESSQGFPCAWSI